jgi:hypothetical protein
MVIKLKRYYGDEQVTKSVMEVLMEGENTPRLVCEAREVGFKDYAEAFPGASRYCLPRGKWRLECGGSPYSPMGVRVVKCPGHRQTYFGPCGDGYRKQQAGRVMIGEPVYRYYTDEEGNEVEYPKKRGMKNGREVYEQLDELLYEAYGTSQNFSVEISNFCEFPCFLCEIRKRAMRALAEREYYFTQKSQKTQK